MGVAAAYELGRRGIETILLEQFAIGHERGSSRGPTRIFRHAYAEDDYVRLAQSAYVAWRALEEVAQEPLLRLTGELDIGPHLATTAAALARVGIAHEVLSGADVAERFPAVDFAGIDEVLHHSAAGVIRSQAAIQALARLAHGHGVVIREGARVAQVEAVGGGVRVRTTDEEFRAQVAILTTGAWSQSLLERAGVSVSIAASSTHVAYFRAAASDPAPFDVPVVVERGDDAAYTYVVPSAAPGNNGVKVGRYLGDEPAIDADARTLEVDPDIVALHAAYVRRRLPGLDAAPASAESCLYEMTPSEDFVIDRRGPIVVGAGFSGHGFKFVPMVGRLLADLASGRRQEPPLDRFSIRHHLRQLDPAN